MEDNPVESSRCGPAAVRLQDIADRLEVSASTVSRALAGHASISESTRAAVQQTAAALGFRFGAGNRRARKAGTRMIALVVDNFGSAFLPPLVQELQQAFAASGYRTVLIVDSLDETARLHTFRPLIDGYFDGMVFAAATCDSRIVAELQRRGLPIVAVVRGVDSAVVDTVEVDNFQAGVEAARHLRELGHRRVALVAGPRGTSTSRARAQGVASVFGPLEADGGDIPVLCGPSSREHGLAATRRLLSGAAPPTAIVACNDTIALGVLEAARRADVAVPERLSVIGFDDTPLAGSRLVGLTTVRQPAELLARTAARRLLARIAAPNIGAATHDVLPTQLMARETTGPAPGSPSTCRIAAPGHPIPE